MALKLNKFYHIIYLVVKDCNRGIIAFLSHLDHIAKTEMDILGFLLLYNASFTMYLVYNGFLTLIFAISWLGLVNHNDIEFF